MTATLTLISHYLCPFVQRATIVLLEKGVTFERTLIDLQKKPDWFMALSPLGKVPLLKINQADGRQDVLFESMAICEYLEETQSGEPLYPTTPLERAQARAWVEFGSATLQDAWAFLNAKDEPAAQERRDALRLKLERLDGTVTGPYFGGRRFGMVDVVFAPVFRYFDLLDPGISASIFDDLPTVGAWRRALAARESVQGAVDGDYCDRLLAHLSRVGSRLVA